jgi:hypothetical protein
LLFEDEKENKKRVMLRRKKKKEEEEEVGRLEPPLLFLLRFQVLPSQLLQAFR